VGRRDQTEADESGLKIAETTPSPPIVSVTPTQLFNRPVRVCFYLENSSRRSNFSVSHTVKNSGCCFHWEISGLAKNLLSRSIAKNCRFSYAFRLDRRWSGAHQGENRYRQKSENFIHFRYF
jgi:hypothetical protein